MPDIIDTLYAMRDIAAVETEHLRAAIQNAQAVLERLDKFQTDAERAAELTWEANRQAPKQSVAESLAQCPNCGHPVGGHRDGAACMFAGCVCASPSPDEGDAELPLDVTEPKAYRPLYRGDAEPEEDPQPDTPKPHRLYQLKDGRWRCDDCDWEGLYRYLESDEAIANHVAATGFETVWKG